MPFTRPDSTFRVNHSENEFANGERHINRIESLGNYVKRLAMFNGVAKHTFYLGGGCIKNYVSRASCPPSSRLAGIGMPTPVPECPRTLPLHSQL